MSRAKKPFPWVPLLLLVFTVFVFWGIPALQGEREVIFETVPK
ncbi:hypothetical protein QPK87_37490 [Kamptonema cortianum]|nr:hypothetical protein [Geitlerinema splendidum]MDK3162202.1 hypothetical protein [Kamptonema cortianum]